jgi:hypothetical protein
VVTSKPAMVGVAARSHATSVVQAKAFVTPAIAQRKGRGCRRASDGRFYVVSAAACGFTEGCPARLKLT